MPAYQQIQNGVRVIGAMVQVSAESHSDGAGKPSLMAGKNNDSKILRATHIIVGQVPLIVFFCLLLMTRGMIREALPDKVTIFSSLHRFAFH
jgi:hypothetical protein